MPRYRVLLSRPNAAFVDLLIDAEDEDQARRLACDMAWHDGEGGATLPVSIALYEERETGETGSAAQAGESSRLIMTVGMDESGQTVDTSERDSLLRDASNAPDDDSEPVPSDDGDPSSNVVSLDAFRRKRQGR